MLCDQPFQPFGVYLRETKNIHGKSGMHVSLAALCTGVPRLELAEVSIRRQTCGQAPVRPRDRTPLSGGRQPPQARVTNRPTSESPGRGRRALQGPQPCVTVHTSGGERVPQTARGRERPRAEGDWSPALAPAAALADCHLGEVTSPLRAQCLHA